MDTTPGFDFAVVSPAGPPDAAVAIAGSRAGAFGVLNLELAVDRGAALEEMDRLARHGRGRWGALLDDGELLAELLSAKPDGLHAVLLSGTTAERLAGAIRSLWRADVRAYVVATSLEEALAAEAAGADGVIAKGHEAGGRVGEEGSFVLLQRILAAVSLPVWAAGGIGRHTAAAAYVAGAAGAVLQDQLLLARESPLDDDARARIAAMDGSETTVVEAAALGASLRVYSRPDRDGAAELRRAIAAGEDWRRVITGGTVLCVGQDAAFAADLAGRFGTVGGIVVGLQDAIRDAITAVRRESPLGEGSPLARSHGTRYPIVQGPMTRVSDRAEFAAAVAEAGALPFLALALMREAEVDELLVRTQRLLGDRPWGVGILGFVPRQLRAEQLSVIRDRHPPFALIAGGRPDQARALEDEGIATYLHVPSPGLLRLYLADGARRFVFEGRECGGHVGPRTSLVLWDTMLRVLLDELPAAEHASCHVLLAGGIHDARSAAMAAAATAAAAGGEIRVGALLGTAYLFTREVVESEAITPAFQEATLAAERTVLLESAPGHATRCLPSPFFDQFETEKRRLRAAGVPADDVRDRLEQLNVGRLRIASKGVDRHPRFGEDPDAPKLAPVDAAGQRERGMFMVGQVAALRDRTLSLAELHRDVSVASGELLSAVPGPEPAEEPPPPPPADVAIVGLGCILPEAADVRAFWANVIGKVDAIREVPPERWEWRRYFDPDPATPDRVYSRWGGFVDPVPFDPLAFGLPPKSLRSIEPFQLLALLTARAALDDAGYESRPFVRERTSVILGAGGGGADLAVGYTVRSALPSLLDGGTSGLTERLCERLPQWTEDSFPGLLMNVAAGRIANRLDLGGANYTVDAACASSLTAVSLGVRELQDRTSDMVLAGGVDAIQNPFAYLCFSKTHALSPNGRARPFDAAADGIVISEGFATVVLKRLADAERDGDRVYAVIRGVGAASDGRDRSLTAPRPEGQVRALRRAYAQARLSPATVGLVEAHGTGTVAGDGAEVEALSTLFGAEGAQRQGCAIGSVKSMIGHTKATAGVAGLIKAALALHYRVLPPTLGVDEPNPKARFGESPFYVNSEARPWMSGGSGHPRRAGVSAFGFGGTDFHVVLEEYTGGYIADAGAPVDRWPAELLLWRGARQEIRAAVGGLADRLADGLAPPLVELARTLASEAGTRTGDATLAIVAESIEDLRAKLDGAREALAGDADRVHAPNGVHWAERPLAAGGRVAFLFPGQGSQVVDMGRDIAVAFPEARETFERADRALGDFSGRPLSGYVFPPPSFTAEDAERREAELTETDVAQPALAAADLAYLHVLRALGVEPEMAAGHSFGELVALAAAGCVDEDELVRLSEARGRFMREAAASESGAMAAVDAAPDALEPLVRGGDVVAANLNAPEQTVVSGPRASVGAAVEWCAERGIGARLLPVACAFHTPHMAPAQRRFAEVLERTALRRPGFPVYSNTTGDRHADDPSGIAGVLAEHLVRPVQFVSEVDGMYRDGARVFVEVGPRSVLTGLAGRTLGEREHLAVSVDRAGRPGLVQLLHCIAALASEGVPLSTERLFRGRLPEETAEPVRGGWLVDGGGVRPADSAPTAPEPIAIPEPVATPVPRPEPVPIDRKEDPNVDRNEDPDVPQDVSNGGSTREQPLAPAAMPDRAGEVMSRYHAVMQHFLDAERAVMLTYLGAPRPAVDAQPAAPPLALPELAVALPLVEGAPAHGSAATAQTAQTGPAPAPAAAPTVEHTPAPPSEPPAPQAEAPPQSGNGKAALDVAEIQERLLAIVSERTGYPAETLDLDADLEGDLSIDSIKRVEIAGTLTQTLALPEEASLDVEELTASRTLREVVAALEAAMASAGGEQRPGGQRPFEERPADEERIGRFLPRPASAPAIAEVAGLAGDGAVLIVDDGGGVGKALADALERRGEPASVVAPGEPADGIAERLRAEHGGTKAIVHLVALGGEAEDAGLASLLALSRALRRDLEEAAAAGGAAVLGATRLGGAFGVGGMSAEAAVQGAIPGFLKSLAQEWPAVRVKAVDLRDASPAVAAEQLLAELTAADGLVEVGYRHGKRIHLVLEPAPLSDRPAAEPLSRDDVLLVTGGARGITAQVALNLAERHRPTLILVGRTEPGEEGEETTGVRDPRELRRILIHARTRASMEVTPGLVEQDLRRLVRGREVRENLAQLRATGARVEHVSCDVSDEAALAELIDAVYDSHGRIDGVIHGAGIIEDRLVRDKELDSLERVVATKAGAARTLARKLRPDSLRFLVFFSSVSGRFGNRGQADYAAASEILSKLAHSLDGRWPTRVVSIDWGPWRASGMVSSEVERQFASRGVALIPTEVGCRLLEDELARGRKGEPEVVLGGATGVGSPPPATAAPAPLLAPPAELTRAGDGRVDALRTLTVTRDRYLDDHRVDGRPVLPFAVAMELMAEAAAATRPGADVAGLRGIRLLHGVVVDERSGTPLRIEAVPEGSAVEVTITAPEAGRPHYRAIVDLGAPAGAGSPPPPLEALAPPPVDAAAAYRDLLFHGPLFQGIAAIEGMGEAGAVALLRRSTPAACLDGARGGSWLLDPVLLDSALQMQVLWARLNWDVTLLPAEIGGHRRHASASVAPEELVRHELRIRPESESPICRADHRFHLADGRLLATLEDVVGVGTAALNRLTGARA
jgi:acyl transferase domain-containing protein/NAD(P)H-dependent flavin oxidoreductase YrpB (nitropropane dioxygenase family)/NAD(P)-dependent dehydrogenase (short-subunit alcohol dehydrogenase family)